MKKIIILIILSILLINTVASNVSATTIFLTSDNIVDSDSDKAMLKSIKDQIEQMSHGKFKVVVDPKAPEPGEGTRAMEADEDVRVVVSACCAGNLYILSKYSVESENQVIFVNSGDFDLDNASNLRRAWDDNYSKTTFAGINHPGKLLNKTGINYIQPVKKYSDENSNGVIDGNNEEVIKYIASEIIRDVNSYDNSSKTFDNSLIVTHKLPLTKMTKGSAKLYSYGDEITEEMKYNNYTGPQLLYLTSSYLNGNGLEEPGNYEQPSSPMKYSLFAKDSYSIYEYMEMAGMVRNYMDENHQAPDYIKYDGAYISYYDLQYNFAKLTKNHTDYKHMDFAREYDFEKVNDSILVSFLPFLIIIVIIILVVILIKHVRKMRKRYKR